MTPIFTYFDLFYILPNMYSMCTQYDQSHIFLIPLLFPPCTMNSYVLEYDEFDFSFTTNFISSLYDVLYLYRFT